MFLSISQAAIILGVCPKTLRRWHAKSLLCPDCRTSGGHRHYGLQTFETFLQAGMAPKSVHQKKCIDLAHTNQFRCATIYAQGSSLKQKAD
ncbi:MAG: MerR family transcriptional regulator [Promethearchaeota archaeon]